MKILVGCEYSGIVRDAFSALGHHAVSCDILPTDRPGEHIQGDLFEAMKMDRWDILIAHPPCTYLCNAQLWKCEIDIDRKEKQKHAMEFVNRIYNSDIPHIAIENPKGILSTKWLAPSQIIYPWQFGDPYRKDICLWLKNLPPLISTVYSTKRKSVSNHVNGRMSQAVKSKIKSKFFPGVASAMAIQWNENIVRYVKER